jgi:hypothetical protein
MHAKRLVKIWAWESPVEREGRGGSPLTLEKAGSVLFAKGVATGARRLPSLACMLAGTAAGLANGDGMGLGPEWRLELQRDMSALAAGLMLEAWIRLLLAGLLAREPWLHGMAETHQCKGFEATK